MLIPRSRVPVEGLCLKRLCVAAFLLTFVTAWAQTEGWAVADEPDSASIIVSDPRPPAEDLIRGGPAGPWRRLLLDAMVVEQSQG